MYDRDCYETMQFRMGFGRLLTVYIPEGSLPMARAILDMIAPPTLQPREHPQRIGAHGSHWLLPEQPSLAAIAVLPEYTRLRLLADYPTASRAARAHISEQVHVHCAAEMADLQESARDGNRGLPTLGVGAGATAAHVGNTLAARHVLDAAFGTEDHTRRRSKFLPSMLYYYEQGHTPAPVKADAFDTRVRTLASQPETDYVAAEDPEHDRAMAYLLVRALSHLQDIRALGLAYKHEPIDPITAFAATQVRNPDKYAEAVRMLGTLDPDVLRRVLRDAS